MELGASPGVLSLSPKARRTGLCLRATSPGIYKARRKFAWPVRLIMVRPLTELPDKRCRGVTPMNAASALAFAKRRTSPA